MTAQQIGAEGWNGAALPDDVWHLSASTIGKALASPNLERWGFRRTAEVVVENLPMLQALSTSSPDAAQAFVREARWNAKVPGELSARNRGTALHAYIEARLLGTSADVPTILQRLVETEGDFTLTDIGVAAAQLAPFLPPIEAWLSRFQPVPVEVEQVVYDPARKVAGRLDFKLRLPGTFTAWPGVVDPVVLIDGKSSDKAFDSYGRPTKPYGDSHPLQLASLAHATHMATWRPRILSAPGGGRYYLANPAELALAAAPHPVDGAGLLQITPGHCTLHPVDVGPQVHAYAMCVADAWRWINLVSKSAVKPPVEAAS